jgi:hypothetical protein
MQDFRNGCGTLWLVERKVYQLKTSKYVLFAMIIAIEILAFILVTQYLDTFNLGERLIHHRLRFETRIVLLGYLDEIKNVIFTVVFVATILMVPLSIFSKRESGL